MFLDASLLTDVISVSAGYHHTCALIDDDFDGIGNSVKCWGLNDKGQLGNNSAVDSLEPVDVAFELLDPDAISVSVGDNHTCALLADNTVKCWGYNFYGQLGDDSTTDSLTPVAVSSLAGVDSISAGFHHTCALLSDNTVNCWGYNIKGQLGNDSYADSNTPVVVQTSDTDPAPLSDVIAIASSFLHTCALIDDDSDGIGNSVKCWGFNHYGQLGNNSMVDSKTPVTVHASVSDATPLPDVVSISTSNFHTCALLLAGTMKCWGNNSYGQLGNGTTVDSFVPVGVVEE